MRTLLLLALLSLALLSGCGKLEACSPPCTPGQECVGTKVNDVQWDFHCVDKR